MITTTIESVRHIAFWQQSENGVLTVFPGNDPEGVPFPIARLFTITGVASLGKRANHAHRGCSQLLVCLSGSVEVHIDDGAATVTIGLGADGSGLLIPPMLWNTVTFASPSTVLAVFCDEPYDPADYLRDRGEYMRLKTGMGNEAAPGLECAPSGEGPLASVQSSEFDLAAASAKHPEILGALMDTARRTFGYFDEYLPYIEMHPWVAKRLGTLGSGSHVLDLGAGVTPLPIYLAAQGNRVETVDRSDKIRKFPVDDTWNGWGFFDYSVVDASIRSHHCRAEEFEPGTRFDAIYSIGMIAHMPRVYRENLLRKIAGWLRPGGRFLFSVDVLRATDFVWNRWEGKEVEPVHEHGSIGDIRSSLETLGFDIDEFRVLRECLGSRTDILLADCGIPANRK